MFSLQVQLAQPVQVPVDVDSDNYGQDRLWCSWSCEFDVWVHAYLLVVCWEGECGAGTESRERG